jgi:chromosome segregation ATPase
MANNNNQRQDQIEDLTSRLDWLDEERRKTGRQIVELEQKLVIQGREIENRDQRIIELESEISKASTKISRLSSFDIELEQFKDEVVALLEQYDQRRIQSHDELEKMRRVEHEVQQRELADIRKNISGIGRLEEDLSLRQAEESRLANLIGVLQGNVASVRNDVEASTNEVTFVDELSKTNSRSIADMNTSLIALSKRLDSLLGRVDANGHSLIKYQVGIADLGEGQTELKNRVQNWTEQVQAGEYERNQRQKMWEQKWDESENKLERFTTEWTKFTEQYQEAKMAVEAIQNWQEQIEQQQREASELVRVETNRMQARWDNFITEDGRRRQNFEVDNDQRWSKAGRRETDLLNQLESLQESLIELDQENQRLWRVQSAQSEALKKLPVMWLEEVERAKAHDPNSRRQPALVPVRED